MHKCKYCDKEITEGSTVEGVKCKCDKTPSTCELPSVVVCSGGLCQMRFRLDWQETRINELQATNDKSQEQISELKAICNINRVLGLTPKALEVLIQTQGINTQGLMIAQNPEWSWDKMATDDLIVVGMRILESNEKVAHIWAQFLNDKGINRIQVKKDQLEQTNKKLKQAQDIRTGIANSDGSKKSPAAIKQVLTKEEKFLLQNMKTLGLSQAEMIKSLGFTGMDFTKCRDLKSLGLI
jgi:hypothetical protein